MISVRVSNDILTLEKWRPPHTIWEKMWLKHCTKKASFVQYFIKQIVQFRSGRFKDSLHVRPGTLWTYVLTPSRRTSRHPLDVRPQSQGRTSKGFFAGEFDVLCLLGAVSSLSEKRVFSVAANYDWFYRILRALVNVKMKAKWANQSQKEIGGAATRRTSYSSNSRYHYIRFNVKPCNHYNKHSETTDYRLFAVYMECSHDSRRLSDTP